MPFSLADQLKLLGPRRFEELCAQLVKQEYPKSCHVEGAGGDEGIDIFSGEIDTAKRTQAGSPLQVWQVKFFRDGVKQAQRNKAEESLKRVVQLHQPQCWTLCVPVNLREKEHEWFQSLCDQYQDITFNLWQADEIIRRVRQDKSLIDSYFLQSQPPISEDQLKSILSRLDDFDSVSDLLERASRYSKDASDFYNGTIPDWSDILCNFDAPREQFGPLWQFVVKNSNFPGGRLPFALITGRSGDGKSTVLMRLAAELVEQGYKCVFYCKDDAQSLRADQFSKLPEDAVSFVFIDKITRFEVETLRGFFERLHRDQRRVIIIGAAWRSLWDGLNLSLENSADIFEINLEKMFDRDIDALLDKLGENPARSAEYLGALAELPREEQIALFRRKAERQLLIALLEAKHNSAFESYVRGELEALVNRFGPDVRRACVYISGLHRLDLSMPEDLLKQILPDVYLEDVFGQTHGLLTEIFTEKTGIVTRHALVAEILFGKDIPAQCRSYKGIINAADAEHERLIQRMLHILTLRGEHVLAENLFAIASKKFPHNAIIFHIHAMFARKRGNIERARELFQKAADVDPKMAHTWHAWAIMEKEQGNIPKARELFRKAVEVDPKDAITLHAWAIMEKEEDNIPKARELFRKAADANPKDAITLQAWALMEKEQGNIPKARELFRKAADADPKMPHTWHAWAIMEKELKDIPKARELFQKAADSSPTNAVILQAWALMEKEQGNIPRARELFRKAVEIDPKDAATLHAWALMEKEERDIPKARELFQKAADADPMNTIIWQAWAIMEGKDGDILKARELFQKAADADPRSAPVWQAWAIMEKEQGNIPKARELFRKAVDADPKDAVITLHAWALMEKKEDNIPRARELFQKAADADPRSAPVWHAWAIMEKEQRDIPKARKLFQNGVRVNPKDASIWQAWATMEGEGGDLSKARELFRKAVDADPKMPYIWQAWGLMEKRAGDISKARELFRKAIEIDPKDAVTMQTWALMEKEQGDISKARELFQKAADADPRSAPVWHAWAIMEKEQGNIPKARELFQKAADVSPRMPHTWHAWGLMEKKEGDIHKARQLFKNGVEADPKGARRIWLAWAELEEECNNIGELNQKYSARWLFKKATELNPYYALLWKKWAYLEEGQGNIAEAERLFLRWGEIQRNKKLRGRIYLHLASMFANRDQKKVEKYLLQAIEADYDNPIAHSRLGGFYRFQHEWEKSDYHFKISLKLDPGDNKTQKFYSDMLKAWNKFQSDIAE